MTRVYSVHRKKKKASVNRRKYVSECSVQFTWVHMPLLGNVTNHLHRPCNIITISFIVLLHKSNYPAIKCKFTVTLYPSFILQNTGRDSWRNTSTLIFFNRLKEAFDSCKYRQLESQAFHNRTAQSCKTHRSKYWKWCLASKDPTQISRKIYNQ